MTNKELYDKIINDQLEGIKPVQSLGYPFFKSTNTTTYAGSNLISKTALCEDTIDVPNQTDFTADVLIVGGGGGGGTGLGGGGGGAGGYREFTKKYFTGTSYTVTVGAGGSASSTGSDSSIERIGSGGGAGGVTTGGNGGSGGGGAGFFASAGGSSTSPRCNGSSQGNAGDTGNGSSAQGGGGGGAAAAGSGSGNGGNGTASSITGSSVTRAGGGGGGDTSGGFGSTATPGSGGSGGGGDGGSGNQTNDSAAAAGDDGTANTGGGGGGGAYYKDSPGGSNLSGTGGNGGSGFICIKFPDTITITVGGGLTYTSSTSGGYTTVQFTAGTDTIEFFWNPKTYSGLELWLDSNDSETITLNGGTVSQWDDKSGNNYHVSQGTASNQPTLTPNALNSRDVLRFDGGDWLQNLVATPVGGSTNRTIFIVANYTGSGIDGIDYLLYLGTAAASPSYGSIFGISQEIAVRVSNGNRIWTTSAGADHMILTVSLDGTNNTDVSAWQNGAALTISSTFGSQTINTNSRFYVGGPTSTVGNLLEGDIAEVLVYSSALSTSQRQQVESYLSNKWGIS